MRRTAGHPIVLIMLAAVGCAGVDLGPGRTDGPPDPQMQALAEGRKLLEQGRYDEAFTAYGRWRREMGYDLRNRVWQAKREGKSEDALKLCCVYLDYFPFGRPPRQDCFREWDQVAGEYLDLLAQDEREARAGQPAQDLRAVESWRRLWSLVNDKASSNRQIQQQIFALADEIMAKFPQSHFAPAAALTAGLIAGRIPHGASFSQDSSREVQFLEKYLQKFHQAGAPKRSRILLLLRVAESCGDSRDRKKVQKAVAAYRQIAHATEIAYERRFALLEAGKKAVGLADEESIALGRKLLGELLSRYPVSPEADQARAGIVRSYIIAKENDQALRALRELEQSAPAGADFAKALFEVSRAYFKAEQYDRSLALLEEIVERYPQTAAAALAQLGMGEVYGQLGEEEKMLAAYRLAATLKPAETHTSIMDASNTRNRAFEFLGNYYMRKRNWAEALRWWQRWTPGSWCGTCEASMESRRVGGIAVCQMRMGKKGRARKTLEKALFERDGGPQVATLLVDTYRDRRRLAAVEARLKRALKKNPYHSGVKAGLKYIEFWRLGERGRYGELWKHLRGQPGWEYGHPWETLQAANVLAAGGEKVRPFLMEKLQRPGKQTCWALVLLARTEAPGALGLIGEKIPAERTRSYLKDYFYALTMLGTEQAYGLIQRYAEGRQQPHRDVAGEILRGFPPP